MIGTVPSAMRYGYPRGANDLVPITVTVRTQTELLNLRAEKHLDTFDDAVRELLELRRRQASPPALPRPPAGPASRDEPLRALCGAAHRARVNGKVRLVTCRLYSRHSEHAWWGSGARARWSD